MTTAMTNNGNGIPGFIAELNLDDRVTESTKDAEPPTVKPIAEPESYVLLLIDACSHAVSGSTRSVG